MKSINCDWTGLVFNLFLDKLVELHKLNLRTLCLPTDADSKHFTKNSIAVAKHFGSGLNYHSAKALECKEQYSRIDGFPGTLKK